MKAYDYVSTSLAMLLVECLVEFSRYHYHEQFVLYVFLFATYLNTISLSRCGTSEPRSKYLGILDVGEFWSLERVSLQQYENNLKHPLSSEIDRRISLSHSL